MSDRFIVVAPEARGGWAVIRPGQGAPLFIHESASEAERVAQRECEADEQVVVRDRYGRMRSASRFGAAR